MSSRDHVRHRSRHRAADLETARLLLSRLNITPEELVNAAPARPPAPTFAEYVPAVTKAVSPGTRRTYGPYWNYALKVWGERRLTEVAP